MHQVGRHPVALVLFGHRVPLSYDLGERGCYYILNFGYSSVDCSFAVTKNVELLGINLFYALFQLSIRMCPNIFYLLLLPCITLVHKMKSILRVDVLEKVSE